MRSYLKFLLLSFLVVSCSDGEIEVTTFDFADTSISSCNTPGTNKLLFKLKTDPINEALILNLSSASFSDTLGVLINTPTETPLSINLTSTGANQLIYRTFDDVVTNAYFCSEVPQSTPKVIQEYISEGGTVVIKTQPTMVEDTDGDGVKDLDEFDGDTDGDGIQDKFDIDDDGDSVLTKTEIGVSSDTEFNDFPDTDGDEKPNYLDPDDDDDSTFTKYEITSLTQKPQDNSANNEGPAYLNKNVNNKFAGEPEAVPNYIPVKYSSLIQINNLVLKDRFGNGEEIKFEGPFQFGTFNSVSIKILYVPIPVEDSTEEN